MLDKERKNAGLVKELFARCVFSINSLFTLAKLKANLYELCLSTRHGVPSSRVADHMNYCHAVCSNCYLLAAPAHAAPFMAKWNTKDLGLQHVDCRFANQSTLDYSVSLCRLCSELDSQALSALRERRDTILLIKALCRSVYCAACDRNLPKGRRRWWICEGGRHECLWEGHNV